jgi:lysozyme
MTNDKIEEIKQICIEYLLVPFESYAKKLPNGDCTAYPDPAGKNGLPITIGYGSTYDELGNPVKMGDVWTYEKAVRVKSLVLNRFINELFSMSPGLFGEPSKRIAAVLSWIYNCGSGNYRISTFRKKINDKDWIAAAEECMKWNKANGQVLKGLARRRRAEALMILNA